MPNTVVNGVNTTVGLLIDNPANLPDGTVQTPFINTIGAAGTNQATAAAIPGEVTVVSGASGTNGVILPVPTQGQRFEIISSAATNALLVFPPLGGTINYAAVNASLSVAARKKVMLIALDNTGNYAATLSA
jgi:hypothetical protein